MTVYIDVLFFTNLIINCFLLSLAARLSAVRISRARLVLSAAIGAIYAVCVFFPELGVIYTALGKLVISLIMIAAGFKIDSARKFLRLTLSLYVSSFVLGGAAFALFYFTSVGAKLGAVYSNGVMYFNLPWQLLFSASALCAFLMRLAGEIYRKNFARSHLRLPLTVSLSGKSVTMTALIDSGNALVDPLDKSAVIVAEYDSLAPIFSDSAKNFFEKYDEKTFAAHIGELEDSGLRLRAIPFSSLGREKGLLIGFLPDSVHLREREIGRCVVGVYSDRLTAEGGYNALVAPQVLGG